MRKPTSKFTALAATLALAAMAACSGKISDGLNSLGFQAGGPQQGAAGGGAGVIEGIGGAAGTTVVAATCVPQVTGGPLQRLTQQQYANSVKALLQLPSLPQTDLPMDEKVGPFNANTMETVGSNTASQYLAAAMSFASAAMPTIGKLLPCDPAQLTAACTQSFITSFGAQVFRRPVAPDELTRYTTLANTYPETDTNGIRLVIAAMIQSPGFLYRPEFGASPGVTGGPVALSPYEAATRLAFFFTNSTPDATLLKAAADHSLEGPSGVAAQVDRLIAGPGYDGSLANFISGLFDLQGLAKASKDPARYPQYTPAVEAALAQETNDFASHILRQGDGTWASLLTSSDGVLTDPLFSFYGVTKPANFVPGAIVPLDPTQRAGILTRGAFLAARAHYETSAPVLRGETIRQNLFCQVMPAPPPGVKTVLPPAVPGETTRELQVAHEVDPSCAGCHLLMDPIGFGLENYDGIGAWRTTDNGHLVDPSGKILATPATNVSFANGIELSKILAQSPDVANCLAVQVFRFGLARRETQPDACTLAKLSTAFQSGGGNLRQMMINLATSDVFSNVSANSAAKDGG